MTIDPKKLMEIFINPTKSSLLLTIQQQGELTAKELLQYHPEIPQATLYRTLKQLTKLNILKVVAETPIRAVVERTYGLIDNLAPEIQTMIRENNGPAYFQLMSNFSFQLMAEFKEYAQRDQIDILNDGSGFSATPIYVNEEELKELAQKMSALLSQYNTRSTEAEANQKLHTLALIITPPKETGQ